MVTFWVNHDKVSFLNLVLKVRFLPRSDLPESGDKFVSGPQAGVFALFRPKKYFPASFVLIKRSVERHLQNSKN